jgi:DNA polymerase-1
VKTLIFDIEGDGFLDTISKLHSLVLKDPDTGEVASHHDEDVDDGLLMPIHLDTVNGIDAGLRRLMEADLIVGHNIIAFDIPAIQKLYPWFKPKGQVRDTLVMSRLAYSDMREADFAFRAKKEKKGLEWIPGKFIGSHSLEAWGHRLGEWKGDYSEKKKAEGKELGIPKAELDLWVWSTWNEEMQDYCVQDVIVTEKLWIKLRDKLIEWGLDPFDFNPPAGKDAIQLEHDVAAIMHRQEQYGVRFDEKKAAALYAHLTQRQNDLAAQLQEVFKPWWRNRGRKVTSKSRSVKRSDLPFVVTVRRFSKTGKELEPYVGPVKEHYTEGVFHTAVSLEPFNPGSREDVADRLKEFRGWKPLEFTKDGKPKVDEDTLKGLPWPEAKLLVEYFMVQKRLGQLASGEKSWMRNVRPDGRIGAAVIPNGAVTGRMTHRGVANVPSIYDKKTGELLPYGRECRELFTASEGKVQVGVDADALELRILGGYMARYDGGAYIDTILNGKKEDGTDMHSRNAAALGIFREAAKTWFYAFIYGAWHFTLGLEAGGTGTKSEITALGKKTQAAFLKNLPALAKLIDKVKARANSRGYIIGVDGRRIPIRKDHAALNTLLQSAGAIMMKRALVILDQRLPQLGYVTGKDWEFIINMHDEFQIDSNEDIAPTIKEEAQWSIAEAGRYYDFGCPLVGSGSIGLNWAETH